jgi:hypothetical protein
VVQKTESNTTCGMTSQTNTIKPPQEIINPPGNKRVRKMTEKLMQKTESHYMETRQKTKKADSRMLLGKNRFQPECKIKSGKSKKSTKQFDFFYHRSCFRTMDEFYKAQYHQFYESFVSKSIPDFDKKQGTGSITKKQMNRIL